MTPPSLSLIRHGLPPSFKRADTAYAISLDLDAEQLRTHYGGSYNNAHLEIRRVLQARGFTWQQGSTYFGGPDTTAVGCVLAAQALGRTLPWFAASVRDIRMMRIEELNDLMEAVREAAGGPNT